MADNDILAQAEATYDSEHPFATGGNPVAPVTHEELGLVLGKLVANLPDGKGGGISKAEVQSIATKAVADFGNSDIFSDVVNKLIDAKPQPDIEAIAAAAISNFVSSPVFADMVGEVVEAKLKAANLAQAEAPIKGTDNTAKPSRKGA
jgi:uncharacterized Ntn-hydrolase superfamily protein